MNDLLEPTNYGTDTAIDSIVYNTVRTEDGWRIEARLPRSVPSSDRDSVLKWFEEYRREITKAYPLWITVFKIRKDQYCLEIKQNSNARELLNSLQEKVSTNWEEDPTYGR